MSSAYLAEGHDEVLAAWETRGQVQFARIDPRDGSVSSPVAPAGRAGERKHPAIAANGRGEMILVWTEGTGWQKGGSLAWQVFDKSGKPTAEQGRVRNGVPVWGLAAVVALPDGGFTVIY